MDSHDVTMLQRLMFDGRASWADLGADLDMAPTSAADRVRRLEREGVIVGYAALVDPAAVGLDLTAFVAVTLEGPHARAGFLAGVTGIDEIVECHHTAGDDDYLLKVVSRGTSGLERIVSEGIKGLPGVTRTRTTVVLSTAKDSVALPVAADE